MVDIVLVAVVASVAMVSVGKERGWRDRRGYDRVGSREGLIGGREGGIGREG